MYADPVAERLANVEKWNPLQPRDRRGRWSLAAAAEALTGLTGESLGVSRMADDNQASTHVRAARDALRDGDMESARRHLAAARDRVGASQHAVHGSGMYDSRGEERAREHELGGIKDQLDSMSQWAQGGGKGVGLFADPVADRLNMAM